MEIILPQNWISLFRVCVKCLFQGHLNLFLISFSAFFSLIPIHGFESPEQHAAKQNERWNSQAALNARVSHYRTGRIVHDMKENVHRLLHGKTNYCFILFLTIWWKLAKMNLLYFLSNHSGADVSCSRKQNKELLTVISFYFSPETALQMCQADVLSSSLSSSCRFIKPTSQSQHCAQVISHLSPPLPLKKRQLACLPPCAVLCFFFFLRFDETRPTNEG